MFGKKKQNQTPEPEAVESRLIDKAMNLLSENPRAYEAIQRQLGGRTVSSLSERELMAIINRAIDATQGA
jgi:hypothetical protein